MTKHRLGVIAACGAAALALAAPASSPAQVDTGNLCDPVLGSTDTTYDLGVVRARVKTCHQAGVPQCNNPSETIDVGPFVRITFSICAESILEDL